MARRTHFSIPVLALLAFAGAALAAETPVTVSPGNPSKLALIDPVRTSEGTPTL